MSISTASIYTYPIPTLSDGTPATTSTTDTSSIDQIRAKYVEILGQATDAYDTPTTYYGLLKAGLKVLNDILDDLKIPESAASFIDPNDLATTFDNLRKDAFYTAAQTINEERVDGNCREGFLAYRHYLKTIVSAFERIYGYLEESRKALEAIRGETDSNEAHAWITRLDIYEQFIHDEFKELCTYYKYNNDTKLWEKTYSDLTESQLGEYEDIPYYMRDVVLWRKAAMTENFDEKTLWGYRANADGRLVDKNGNPIRTFFYQYDTDHISYTEDDGKTIPIAGMPKVKIYNRQTGEEIGPDTKYYIGDEGRLVTLEGENFSPECDVMVRFTGIEEVTEGENKVVVVVSGSSDEIKVVSAGEAYDEDETHKTVSDDRWVFYRTDENGEIVQVCNDTREIKADTEYEVIVEEVGGNNSVKNFTIGGRKYGIMNFETEKLHDLSLSDGFFLDRFLWFDSEYHVCVTYSESDDKIKIKFDSSAVDTLQEHNAEFVEINDAGEIIRIPKLAQPVIEARSRELQPLRETQVACTDSQNPDAKRQLDVFRAVTLLDRLRYVRYYYKLILQDGAIDYSVFPNDADTGYPCLPDVQSTKATEDTKSLGAMEMFYVGYLTDRDGPINAVSSFFEVKTAALRNNLALQSQKISALNIYLDFINAGLDLLNESQKNGTKRIPSSSVLALTYLCGQKMYNLFEDKGSHEKFLVIPSVLEYDGEKRYLLVKADQQGRDFLLGRSAFVKKVDSEDTKVWGDGYYSVTESMSSGEEVLCTAEKDTNPETRDWFSEGEETRHACFSTKKEEIEGYKAYNRETVDITDFKLPTQIECMDVSPTSVSHYEQYVYPSDWGSKDSDKTAVIKSWTDAFSNKSQYINTAIDTINTDVTVDRSKIDTLDSLTSTFRSRAQDTYLNTVANIRG